MHPPGFDLHHEDIQPLEEHGVGVHEVTGQQTGGLGGQELPPTVAKRTTRSRTSSEMGGRLVLIG
jgi:hypothetical protein